MQKIIKFHYPQVKIENGQAVQRKHSKFYLNIELESFNYLNALRLNGEINISHTEVLVYSSFYNLIKHRNGYLTHEMLTFEYIQELGYEVPCVQVSMNTLCDIFDISLSGMKKVIKNLTDLGLISKQNTLNRFKGTGINLYYITDFRYGYVMERQIQSYEPISKNKKTSVPTTKQKNEKVQKYNWLND